jgi:hypothetical protein
VDASNKTIYTLIDQHRVNDLIAQVIIRPRRLDGLKKGQLLGASHTLPKPARTDQSLIGR